MSTITYDWKIDPDFTDQWFATGHAVRTLGIAYIPTDDPDDLPYHVDLLHEEDELVKSQSFRTLDAAKWWAESEDLLFVAYERQGWSMDSNYDDGRQG